MTIKTTTIVPLGVTWVRVAEAGQTLLAQVPQNSAQIFYAFADAQPSASNSGHVINVGETLIESNLTSDIWMRTTGGEGRLIATVGGTGTTSASHGTTQFNLTTTWQQVSDAGQNVRLDAMSGVPIIWRYSIATPATDSGHVLYPGDEYIDAATDNNIWARADSREVWITQATLIVTKG